MTWHTFEVILRLRSPLHIGCGKVGNLQRTRPYVTSRVLWGALTMRLTRDKFHGDGPATDSREYQKTGEQVHQDLAFTYFYPALKTDVGYQVVWPWDDESTFRRRFLSSYQGTALSHPRRSAAEGMLHEVEFISPNTLDTGEAVFLKGYVFEKEGCTLKWQSALKRLQMGGERGYGWGDVQVVESSEIQDNHLFNGRVTFTDKGERPIIHLPKDSFLLAHTLADNVPALGDIEPLVGREWRSDAPRRRYAGQFVAFNDVCFIPGSRICMECSFQVQTYGIWQRYGAVD